MGADDIDQLREDVEAALGEAALAQERQQLLQLEVRRAIGDCVQSMLADRPCRRNGAASSEQSLLTRSSTFWVSRADVNNVHHIRVVTLV